MTFLIYYFSSRVIKKAPNNSPPQENKIKILLTQQSQTINIIIEIKTEEKLVASFAAVKEPPISCKQETITNTHAYIQTHTITHTLIQIYVKYIKKSSI